MPGPTDEMIRKALASVSAFRSEPCPYCGKGPVLDYGLAGLGMMQPDDDPDDPSLCEWGPGCAECTEKESARREAWRDAHPKKEIV